MQCTDKCEQYLPCMFFVITSVCNLCCRYCYYNSEYYSVNNKEEAYLDPNKLNQFLQTNHIHIGTAFITGGEPLLHENIKEIVSLLSSKSDRVVLFTNGTLLNSEMVSFYCRIK